LPSLNLQGRVTLKKEDIPYNKYSEPSLAATLHCRTDSLMLLHRELLRWFPLYRTKARQGDIVHGELLLRIHQVVRRPMGWRSVPGVYLPLTNEANVVLQTTMTGGICLEPKHSEEEDTEAIEQRKYDSLYRVSSSVRWSSLSHNYLGFRAERASRQDRKEKERPAGKLHLSYLYNPPLGNWDGYLTITSASRPIGDRLHAPHVA
jgi:hypothetical protein